jgi:hypothetical protein
MLKISGVIPRSNRSEESALRNLLIFHNSRFLVPLGMTHELTVTAEIQQPVSAAGFLAPTRAQKERPGNPGRVFMPL